MLQHIFYISIILFSCNDSQFQSSAGRAEKNRQANSNMNAGKNNDGASNSAEFTITSAPSNNNAVDIIWVVDESPSMDRELATVKYNLNSFQNQLSKFSKAKNILYTSANSNWDVGSNNGPICLLNGLE